MCNPQKLCNLSTLNDTVFQILSTAEEADQKII